MINSTKHWMNSTLNSKRYTSLLIFYIRFNEKFDFKDFRYQQITDTSHWQNSDSNLSTCTIHQNKSPCRVQLNSVNGEHVAFFLMVAEVLNIQYLPHGICKEAINMQLTLIYKRYRNLNISALIKITNVLLSYDFF